MSVVHYLEQGIDARRIIGAPALNKKHPITRAKPGVPSGYPVFLPTVVPPTPEQAAVLKEIEVGLLHHEKGDYWQAEKAYRRVIDRHHSPRAKALLGLLLEQKEGSEKTREMMRAGSREDQTDCLIASNWAYVCLTLGRVREAAEAYSQAVEASPQWGNAYIGLGAAFCDLLRHREAVYAYERAVACEPEAFSYWSDLLFAIDISDAHTFDDAMAARRRLNDTVIAPQLTTPRTYTNTLDPDRVLKIGYTSADFYQHSGAMTWGGFFIKHNKKQVHVTAYCGTVKRDHMTAAFEKAADRWHEVGEWSDERLVEQIKKDEIDILVDLGGYSRGGRTLAFASRPAPIQMSGWGYATGMGLDCFDYFATDRVVVPLHDEGRYVERPWILPSILSWVPPRGDIPVGHVRAAMGRPVCFGVFNRQPKITRSFIRVCAEILKRSPGSWMLFKNSQLAYEQVRDAVQQAFEEEGITEPRVMLVGPGNHWDQLSAHWVPDLMLDPFPQGGGVSAFESLWMGVPYVTMFGDRAGGRAAASLLHQVDLADWIVNDEQTYVERAVGAARDIERLKLIRATLRERALAMPAVDTKAYARHVEAGYRARWQAWCAKQQQSREETVS